MKRGAAWTIYHPNGKGTGSAVKMELRPAHGDVEGGILATLAPQKAAGTVVEGVHFYPTFDWEKAVTVRLGLEEITQLVMVLRGVNESVADGKGFFHRSETANAVIKFEHRIEPVPGYMLDISRRPIGSEDMQKMFFFFRPVEATALGLALEGAMVQVVFGHPCMDRDGE